MALREIFAEFGITFDRQRVLARGDQQVSMLSRTLNRLGPVIASVRNQLMTFAAAMGGAVMIRAIRGFIAGIVRIGDDLDKVGQQVGMSSRDLQAWRHAAELSGVDAAAFGNALGQLQRNAHEAQRGTSTMVEAFRDLGISVEDSSGRLKTPNQLMLEMADGLAGIDNETQRTALAMTILGRSGRRMLPLFANGSEGARAMLAELEELGGGMSDLAISESVKLNDEMTRLRLVMLSLKSAVAEDLLPRVRSIVSWFIETRDVVQDITNNSSAMRAAVISAILGIVAVLAVTSPVWGGWALAVGGALILAIALGLAIDDLWKALEGGDSIIGRIGRSWAEFLASFGNDGWYDPAREAVSVTESLDEAWKSLSYTVNRSIDGIIDRLERLVNVARAAGGVITSLGGGAAMTNLGRSLTTLVGGTPTPIQTPEQRAATLASLDASPAAQLRMMGSERQVVNSRVDAPSTVTVHVTEAQDPQATASAIQGRIDASWQRQLRGLQAAAVPATGGGNT